MLLRSMRTIFLFVVGAFASSEIKLGYLYIQSGSSWVVESFSHFKLAIQDVNADSSVLPNHTLNFVVKNSKGNQLVALQGAIDLIDAGVVGIVGTGYSGALPAPSIYCSMKHVPIMSPGSTFPDYVDKSPFPYLLRSIASDMNTLRGFVILVKSLGFTRIACLVSTYMESGYKFALRPAIEAVKLNNLALVYPDGGDAGPDPVKTREVCTLIRNAGHRIILLVSRTSDMNTLDEITTSLGLRDHRYFYVARKGNVVGGWQNSHNVLEVGPTVGKANAVHEAHAARWPQVSTLWKEDVHGAYNASTGLPFFERSIVWDTDYAKVGDGKPDVWGIQIYDAVWAYAKALHALIESGGNPTDGESLKAKLMLTDFAGITGRVLFDPDSQDRSAGIDLRISTPSGNFVDLASSTDKLLTSSMQSDPDWCAFKEDGTGCIDLTAAKISQIPWGSGIGVLPTDGTVVDVNKTTAIVPSNVAEDSKIDIVVDASNSFGEPPCASACGTNITSAECKACQDELERASEFSFSFKDANGAVLQPADGSTATLTSDSSIGRITMTLPKGLQGSGNVDRQVFLSITYQGQPLQTETYSISLVSNACPTGTYQVGSGASIQCSPCLAGTVGPARGARVCSDCALGRYQSKIGQSACAPCPEGFFAGALGASTCSSCEQGRFADQEGTETCRKCDGVLTTATPGAISSSSCVCPEGSYAPMNGKGPCLPCKPGMECRLGSDVANFPANRKNTGNQTGSASKLIYPMVLPRHWSSEADPMSVFRCETEEQCPGGAPDTCGTNLVGPSCTHCIDTWYWTGTECARCTNAEMSKVVFPVLPLVLLPVIVLIMYKLFGDTFERWGSWQNCCAALLFVLLNHYQTLFLMRTSKMKFPVSIGTSFEVWGFTDNILVIFKLACTGFVSFESSVVFRALGPLIILAFTALTYAICLVVGNVLKNDALKLERNRLTNVYMSMIFTFFGSIASMTMLLFKCVDNPNGLSTLTMDLSVVCFDGGRWSSMLAVGITSFIVYVIGSGTLFTWIIIKAPRDFHDPNFQMRWKFLFIKFRNSAYWWSECYLAKNFMNNLGFIVFTSPIAQFYWIFSISILYMAGIVAYMPYRHRLVNALEIITGISLLYSSSMLASIAEEEEEELLGVVATIISFIPIIASASFVLFAFTVSKRAADKAKQDAALATVKEAVELLSTIDDTDLASFIERMGEWEKHELMCTCRTLTHMAFSDGLHGRASFSKSELQDRNTISHGGAEIPEAQKPSSSLPLADEAPPSMSFDDDLPVEAAVICRHSNIQTSTRDRSLR
eukprot:TRINITY_DN14889_c0_g2_i3.p1 TRINITY_DN14889_c0_g2~~TRINITY_DN14889_c0_g2_i3.p1  ORF type:complete len:1298 (-),score=116.22 TRINITY_DN14889_c0_g2_i3:548-4441(-)